MQLYTAIYQEEIDKIKNKLYIIYNKHYTLKEQARLDYEQGIIDEQSYKKITLTSIIAELPSNLKKYSLSKEDIQYLKEYGDIMDGELSSELINPSILKKENLMEEICHSVIKGNELSLMSEHELKTYLKKLLNEKISASLKQNEEIINECRQKYGKDAIKDIRYTKASNEIAKSISHQNEITNHIESISGNELYNYAYSIHKVNIEYLGWFKLRQAHDEIKSGYSFQEGLRCINTTKTHSDKLKKSFNNYTNTTDTFDMFIKDYIQFLNGNYNIKKLLSNPKLNLSKVTIFDSKNNSIIKKLGNMEKVFNYLFKKYPVVKLYLIDVISCNGESDIQELDPKQCFVQYINHEYKDMTPVSLEDFTSYLINNIRIYGEDKLDLLKQAKSSEQSKFEYTYKDLNSSIYLAHEYITDAEYYIRLTREGLKFNLPKSITPEEENNLYNNLVQYLKEQNETKRQNHLKVFKLK